ncbi:MAG: acetate kinase, partial [Rhodospirillales bacterium]|nr:acetate kinase [Rhodospirillales bacterium]
MTPGAVLALNAGSSSIKFALFAGADLARACHGQIEGLGDAPRFHAADAAGRVLAERKFAAGATHEALLGGLLDFVAAHQDGAALAAVGHRVVHGGTAFVRPVRADAAVLAALEALTPLAPLHQPHNLAPIRAIAATRPALPQVACFDTAFHAAMAPIAAAFALPRALSAAGIRRYGFHGISYEYLARRLRALDPALAAGRVIAAHLGNGASLCAMRDGRSVDTTMGFTALDGLMMGTRSGSLDPGVVLHLIAQRGMTAEAVSDLLYHRSG